MYEISPRAFQNCVNLSIVEFPVTAPSSVGTTSFLNIAIGARAVVNPLYAVTFGSSGAIWNGLIVSDEGEGPTQCALEQMQALAAGSPVIAKQPDGSFRLSFKLHKSTDLETFVPLDLSGLNPTINGQGEIELRFTAEEDTAFFRLQFGD